MNKFQDAKIYKITSPSAPGKVYYGSTCNDLKKRLGQHIAIKRYTTSKEVTKYGDATIDLVEDFPCGSREELLRREGWHIWNNVCVNKQRAGRTKKQYYQDTKEIIKERTKARYQSKKEEINHWQKIKHECACGGKYTNSGKSCHEKTVNRNYMEIEC